VRVRGPVTTHTRGCRTGTGQGWGHSAGAGARRDESRQVSWGAVQRRGDLGQCSSKKREGGRRRYWTLPCWGVRRVAVLWGCPLRRSTQRWRGEARAVPALVVNGSRRQRVTPTYVCVLCYRVHGVQSELWPGRMGGNLEKAASTRLTTPSATSEPHQKFTALETARRASTYPRRWRA
jgi:hypothetical protein